MAHQISEPDEMSHRRGSYSPGEAIDAVRPIRVKKLNSENMTSNIFDRIPIRSRNIFGWIYSEMNTFKAWLSRKLCRCIGRISTKVFIVMILFIILITIGLLILLILLTKAELSSSIPPGEQIDNIVNLINQVIPPSISLCTGYGFTCKQHPWMIIGSLKRCDGIADCIDGSDEAGCKRCRTSFNCSKKTNIKGSLEYTCLRGQKICEGSNDCEDKSDEIRFCRSECNQGEFKCDDSKMCIPKDFICDGDNHCKDGSDELNCNGICKNDAVWCGELGKCLSQTYRCDGIEQCPSGIDENCDCVLCSGNSKALCNLSKKCINFAKVCDGIQDCAFGEDELSCPGNCETNYIEEKEVYKCRDGKYYHKKFACSGKFSECDGICKECDAELAHTCDNKQCISRSLVCDGNDDCDDGSDEKNCNCSIMKDHSDTFHCHDNIHGIGKCIIMTQRCDGVVDCLNGKDELDCDECKNSEGIYCNSTKTCLPSTKRCNGIKDCPDGSDEIECTCDECKRHPWPTYYCSKSKECLDRAEACRPYSMCSQATTIDKAYCAAQQAYATMQKK